jgi:RNA polymerase sigma-70 factor (ECF subfamily)
MTFVRHGKMAGPMDEVAEAWARGRAAFPRIRLPQAPFERHYARALAAGSKGSPKALAVEDLYLACACANGVSGSARVFEARYQKVMRRAVSRVLSNQAERDEVIQDAHRVLLVGGADGAPKIGTYLGQGPLENWVAVAAIRLAISRGRAESTERRLRERMSDDALGSNPELLLLKGEIRRELQAAVKDALGRLEERERLVMRLWLVSGSTLATIGKAFGVTQQAVSRWLADARIKIVKDVQRDLAGRLKIAKGELPDVARLLESQVDISISRLLGRGQS